MTKDEAQNILEVLAGFSDGFNRLMTEARETARAAGGRQDITASLVEIVQKEPRNCHPCVGQGGLVGVDVLLMIMGDVVVGNTYL